MKNWFKIKSVIMQEWSESRDALIELFGKVRDEWMDTNLTTWIGDNRYICSLILCFSNQHSNQFVLKFIGAHTGLFTKDWYILEQLVLHKLHLTECCCSVL